MNLALSTDVLVPIGAAVVVVALLLLGWLIVRRVLRSRAASRALASVRQAQRRPAAQPARRPTPSVTPPAKGAAAGPNGASLAEPNGTRLPEVAGPALPSQATVATEPEASISTEPLAAIGADTRRAFAAKPARMPSPRPAPLEPTIADWTGEAAQPSAEIILPPAPGPAEPATVAEAAGLEPSLDTRPDPWPAEDASPAAATLAEEPGSAAADLRPVGEDMPMTPDSRPADNAAVSHDHRPAEAGSPEPGTAGSGQDVAGAVQQALAARALAGRLPQPGGTTQPDLRDRLLAVLLDNPQEALGAAAELDGHRAQLAQLSDALARQEEELRAVVGKLSAAGLATEQVARLANLPQAEVERLLEQSPRR